MVVVDDSAPRNSWIMGRVVKTVKDKGGLVLQVKKKTRIICLDRPVGDSTMINIW